MRTTGLRTLAVFWVALSALSATTVQNIAAADGDTDANQPLRIIVFGAHPDDAEFKTGGSAIQWAKAGHQVKLVSVTNGDIGHWQMAGGPLAIRRAQESKAAAKVMGVTSQVLDIHDGELEPTLENRRTITRLIREWNADVVIAHRPWDYHPDHRYVGVLVQDAAFMVTVPFICPDVPALQKNPIFLYSSDRFEKPYPFRADLAVPIDDETLGQKVLALHELESQVYEGGASGSESWMQQVPPASDVAGRQAWLKQRWERRQGDEANRYRNKLIEQLGDATGAKVRFAETFEICEYGRQPTAKERQALTSFGSLSAKTE